LLREHPANVTELVTLTGRAQSNISRSLQLLARPRLIRLVREGRRSNRIVDLTPYISSILLAASQVGPGRVVTVGA
jgi:predicted transcriptional regulator